MPFDIILAGDFNINFHEAGSATVSDMLGLTKSFGLYQCVNEVTRPNSHNTNRGSCIDNVSTSLHPDRWTAEVTHLGVSDHNDMVLGVDMDLSLHNTGPSSLVRPMSMDNSDPFLFKLKTINWLSVYNSKLNVNSKFNIFHKLFLKTLNSSIGLPLKLLYINLGCLANAINCIMLI